MARTTSTGNKFNFRIPKDVHRVIRLHCMSNDTSMKDWVVEACRQFLEEREEHVPYSGAKGGLDFELPYAYIAVPSKTDDDEVQVFSFTTTENFADLIREQADEDGVSTRDLVWTAMYRRVVRYWKEQL